MIQKFKEAKKAIACLATMEAAAISLGVIDGRVAFWVTGVLGVLTAGVTYMVPNDKKVPSDKTGKHEAD